MVDIFVSYAREDSGSATEIARQLREAGHNVFHDADRKNGIPPGAEWQRKLIHELRHCDAVVFLNSRAAQDSEWCHSELAIAAEHGKQVYSLDLYSGMEPHALLAARQGIPFEDNLEAGIERLIDELGAGMPGRGSRPRWDPHRSPYPGLAVMEAADAGVFFGRERDLDDLTNLAADPAMRDGDVVAVTGPSGAGKSSLVRAGLAAGLARSPAWTVAAPFEPGRNPLAALAGSLAALAPDGLDEARCRDMLLGDEGLAAVAGLLIRQGGSSCTRLLIIVDQAEQLVTVTSSHDADEFLSVLKSGLGEGSPVTVVLTIRSDRLDEVKRLPVIGPRLRTPFLIGPILRPQLGTVIQGPADKADLSFEPGLVAEMIDDATRGSRGEAVDALPLLAFTLEVMYRQLTTRKGREFTKKDYEDAGKIKGAINGRARAAEHMLSSDEVSDLDRLLLRFVVLAEDRPPAARPVPRAQMPAAEQGIAKTLEDYRLLTGDKENVKLAHEQLITAWPHLASVVASHRDELLQQVRLERQAKDWKQGNGHLLGRAAAATAAAWLAGQAGAGNVDDAVREYVEQSVKAVRRRRAQVMTAFAIITALVVIASVMSAIAFRQSAVAAQQRSDATYNQVVGKAASSDTTLGALLLLAAYRNQPPALHETDLTQRLVGTENTPLSIALAPDGSNPAYSVAFSPRGSLLAAGTGGTLAADSGGYITMWDVSVPDEPRKLGDVMTSSPVNSLAFSPDGTLLAAGTDGGLYLWTISAGGLLMPLDPSPVSTVPVSSVAFSPDGLLAAATADGMALWDTAPPGKPRYLGTSDSGTSVDSVAFSPDGLLAAGAGGQLQLWQTAGAGHLMLLSQSPTGNGDTVGPVAFSPNGRIVADGTSEDSSIWLWNTAVPAQPVLMTAPLTGSTGTPESVAFSPDGEMMASASLGGTIRLWSLPQTTIMTSSPVISSAAFSPDGQVLASGGIDGMLQVWNLADPTRPRPLAQATAAGSSGSLLYAMRFSPRGHLLASGAGNGTIQLWDMTDPSRPAPLGQPFADGSKPISWLAFSPSGTILAAGAFGDSVIRLWDLSHPASPRLAGQIQSGAPGGLSVAFSPDGNVLADGSRGSTIQLWDLTDPGRPRLLNRLQTADEAVSLAFSPDSRTLAAGYADGAIQLWDVAVPSRPHEVSGPLTPQVTPGEIVSMAFSPDGNVLATGSQNGATQLFDTSDRTGKEGFPTLGPPLVSDSNPVYAVAFRPAEQANKNGADQVLATASQNGVIRLWNLNPGYAISRICPTFPTNLTPQTWKAEITGLPYQQLCNQ
jgi:WD40 repeat protein